MKRLIEFFKAHRKIFTIAVLLALMIALAFVLFGTKNKAKVTVSGAAQMSDTEVKLTRILSGIEGVGQTEVMVNESGGGVVGVIIVCEGANNIMTRNDILNAVTCALKVEKNNIAIYAMNK